MCWKSSWSHCDTVPAGPPRRSSQTPGRHSRKIDGPLHGCKPQQSSGDAGRLVCCAGRLAFGGAALSEVDAEDGHGTDREELRLPVL